MNVYSIAQFDLDSFHSTIWLSLAMWRQFTCMCTSRLWICSHNACQSNRQNGGAECAGQENDGQGNFRGWKLQDWKMTDKSAGWKMQDWKLTDKRAAGKNVKHVLTFKNDHTKLINVHDLGVSVSSSQSSWAYVWRFEYIKKAITRWWRQPLWRNDACWHQFMKRYGRHRRNTRFQKAEVLFMRGEETRQYTVIFCDDQRSWSRGVKIAASWESPVKINALSG